MAVITYKKDTQITKHFNSENLNALNVMRLEYLVN